MTFAVVIPSRTPSNLIPCVEAIVEHEPDISRSNIVVVDDSGESTDILIYARSAGITWVKGIKPFVFARAVNMGVAAAADLWPDVSGIIACNDDALLQSYGGFSLLAQAAANNPEYGLIGAVTNVVGNPNQFCKGIGLRSDPRMVCFVCVYIPRTTIEQVGLLDTRFSGYGFDDDDFSLRVRRAGLRIGIHDGCVIDHGRLLSTFRGDPQTPANLEKNAAIFKAKWGHDNWGRP